MGEGVPVRRLWDVYVLGVLLSECRTRPCVGGWMVQGGALLVDAGPQRPKITYLLPSASAVWLTAERPLALDRAVVPWTDLI